jgi:outer membrane protein OmpA-like peptidoglycan-associated protein
MTKTLATSAVLAALVLAGGCATKTYVRKQTEPIQGQVDELAKTSSKHGELIEQSRQDIRRNELEISANKEATKLADQKAATAQSIADAAGQKSTQNTRDIEALRNVVANIDDYKVGSEGVVLFAFNSDVLTPEGQAELDKVATGMNGTKRFFFAVEGYTDQVGPADYNLALSRRRADRVVNYLVTKHNIPIYRIYNIGLGKARPVEEANTRDARARNRRVEVRFYNADAAVTAANPSPSN